MAITNVQFTVSTHIMTALAYHYGMNVTSATLAGSIRADRTFVRRSVSKLTKAGLIVATRGRSGACVLARPADSITLLDIYRASEAPPTFAIHSYNEELTCPVSCSIKAGMGEILDSAQAVFEVGLAKRTLADLVSYVEKRSMDCRAPALAAA
jgi:DNA-binding IscR family transcriptional regulator